MKKVILSLLAAGAFAVPTADAAPPAASPLGNWENPRHSITVRVEACGNELCGKIVGATPEALSDAKAAGITNLIGTQLLSNYRQTGNGKWYGTVYVPDMGRSFSSRIVQLSPNTLRISGCLVGGFLCKSQDWTRI